MLVPTYSVVSVMLSISCDIPTMSCSVGSIVVEKAEANPSQSMSLILFKPGIESNTFWTSALCSEERKENLIH